MSNPSRVNPCVYELSLVERAPLPHQPFDRDWNPDSLSIPDDFTQTMLAGLRGTATRDAVCDAIRAGDLEAAEQLRRTREPYVGQLPAFAKRDPGRMAGLYLRPFQRGEVELARLEWRGVDATVISVRAHPVGAKWRLSIVDEEGLGFEPPSNEPVLGPELGDVVAAIEQARIGSKQVSLTEYLFARIRPIDPDPAVGSESAQQSLLRISSPYFPMLGDYVAADVLARMERLRVAKEMRTRPLSERCPLTLLADWDPSRISVWVARELTKGSVDSLVAGLAGMEDATGRFPAARTGLWLYAGVACERVGQYEAAAAVYAEGRKRRSRELDQVYWLHNNAGYSLNQLGRYDEALSLLSVAVDVAPDPHNAWKNLGVSWQGLGRWEAAAVAYGRAFMTAPQDRRALALLEELMLGHRELRLHELPELRGLREFLQGVVDGCD